jgi:hypothetical protein
LPGLGRGHLVCPAPQIEAMFNVASPAVLMLLATGYWLLAGSGGGRVGAGRRHMVCREVKQDHRDEPVTVAAT